MTPSGLRVADSDMHIFEPADLWQRYIDPAWRHAAPVGLTEAQAKEKGLNTKVTVSDMEYWFSTQTFAETKVWAKVIVDEESDAILGAHMVGDAAEELINIFGLAKKHGITATALRDFIYAYPSFSSDIKHML